MEISTPKYLIRFTLIIELESYMQNSYLNSLLNFLV